VKIQSGKTDQYIYFIAVDATDRVTRETGLSSFTVYRSRKGAAEAAYTTPTIVEIDATNMPGVYALLLDEDTTIDAASNTEEYCVHITHAGMDPVTRVVELFRNTVDGKDLHKVLAVIAAAVAGKASGMGTTTNTFRDIADARNAIVATTDADGNRSAVTIIDP
jgi:hypothetical protein